MKPARIFLIMLAVLALTSIAGAQNPVWNDLPEAKVTSGDWPWWRGPTRNGKAAPSEKPPTTWSKTENIVWKTNVPGKGHGSPIVIGRKLFLCTADKAKQTQSLICYDTETGKKLWDTTVHKGKFVRKHKKNSYASGTPACDGDRVFTNFAIDDAIWVSAIDLIGKIVWQKRIGDFKSLHGFVGTPLLYKSIVINQYDSKAGSFAVALHRKTGKEIWRAKREVANQTFSSPMVGRLCGKDQLVLVGPQKTESYDPMTGKRYWICDGPTLTGATTAAFGNDIVYVSAGWPERHLLAINGDGQGDVTKSHIAWKVSKNTAYVTSMLLHEGLLYMVYDNKGILRVFDAKTGKQHYEQQMTGPCSSSPMLAGGNIYLVDEKGKMNVFKPGPKFQKVAVNDLGDGGFASPVFVNNRIYLRTLNDLYCIGEK